VPPPALARVADLIIESRTPLAPGLETGAAGAYEQIEGRIIFETDPALPANQAVVDLALPAEAPGKPVRSEANFIVWQPADPAKRRGQAWLEVSNRGGRGMGAVLVWRDPAAPEALRGFGDALMLRQGLTLAWVGWQWDVPPGEGRMWLKSPRVKAPDGGTMTGLVRTDLVMRTPMTGFGLGHNGGPGAYPAVVPAGPETRLTRRTSRYGARELVPASRWRFSADRLSVEAAGRPFEPGYIYELVYRAADPAVAGLGLTALRDMAGLLKDKSGPFGVSSVVGFGVSQSGRLLRHFLHDGFNRLETGGRAFDGMFIMVAGAGRGSFNHRFAEPGRDAQAFSSFLTPTDEPPFDTPSLLARTAPDHQPKIMQINGGYEYWARAAALIHADPATGRDRPGFAGERLYHLASAPHQIRSLPADPPGPQVSALDQRPAVRALAMAMMNWVADDRPPPPSRVPAFADGTLVTPGRLTYPAWVTAKPAPPLDGLKLDHGAQAAQGVFSLEPPRIVARIKSAVPALDAYGNERGGIRGAELFLPLATFTPWALWGAPPFAAEFQNFVGGTWPRPGRPDRAAFLKAVDQASDALIAQGLMLAEDRPRVLARQAATYDWITAAAR